MSYNRQPNVIVAGRALKQTPASTTISPPGIIPVALDTDIATTSALGVIKVGSGLSITPEGLLSAINCNSLINVYNTDIDYTATASDEYIGCCKKDIVITLPLGVKGKLYIVKNQSEGSIRVQGSLGQKLDNSTFKILGSLGMLLTVFDGTRWSLI